jgi:SprT protein
MPSLRQLEFVFRGTSAARRDDATAIGAESFRRGCNLLGELMSGGQALRLPYSHPTTEAVGLQSRGRDVQLEAMAREILRSLGATKLAREIRMEWNPRLKTCAGRADYRLKLISLNPQLINYPAEIDRTLRHELAHILAGGRAGRRKIHSHGVEWKQACRDLGISGENRCHSLPFPVKQLTQRYLYRCPNCQRNFPRVRRIKRAIACLACCHAHNGGEFDARFRLRLVML